ncbi:MAG: histidine phosphatase family protein [Pseudomonadota bacterium]
MSVNLYIVRHGNTFGPTDTVRRVGARTDLPLVETGHKQANSLGNFFKDRGIIFAAIYSSPLERTRQTAGAINDNTASTTPIRILPFLKEIDYGIDDGRPEDDVIARLGAETLAKWEREAVLPDGWCVDVPSVKEGWLMLRDELNSHGGSPCLCVTSNGIARYALMAYGLEGVVPHRKLRTGAFGHIRFENENATLIAWDVRPGELQR